MRLREDKTSKKPTFKQQRAKVAAARDQTFSEYRARLRAQNAPAGNERPAPRDAKKQRIVRNTSHDVRLPNFPRVVPDRPVHVGSPVNLHTFFLNDPAYKYGGEDGALKQARDAASIRGSSLNTWGVIGPTGADIPERPRRFWGTGRPSPQISGFLNPDGSPVPYGVHQQSVISGDYLGLGQGAPSDTPIVRFHPSPDRRNVYIKPSPGRGGVRNTAILPSGKQLRQGSIEPVTYEREGDNAAMALIARNTARALQIAQQKDTDAAYKAAEDLASHTPQVRVRGKVTRTPPVTAHPTYYKFHPDKKGTWFGNVGPGAVPVRPHFKGKESAKVFPSLLKDPTYRRLTKDPRNVATANVMGLPITGEAANRYIQYVGGLIESHLIDPNDVPGFLAENRGQQLARLQARVRLLRGYSKADVDAMSFGNLIAAAKSPHGKYTNAWGGFGGRFVGTVADNLASDIGQAILGVPMGAAMLTRGLVHDVTHPGQQSQFAQTASQLAEGMYQFGADIKNKPYETFTHHPATTALALYGAARPVFGKYGLGALSKPGLRTPSVHMAQNEGEFIVPGQQNPDLPLVAGHPPRPPSEGGSGPRGIGPPGRPALPGEPGAPRLVPSERTSARAASPKQRALDAAKASDVHAARTDAEIRVLLDEARVKRAALIQDLRNLPPGHPSNETIRRGGEITAQIRELDTQIQHYHTDLSLPHPGHPDELAALRDELAQGIKNNLPQESLIAIRSRIDEITNVDKTQGHPLRDYHLITRDLGDYPEVNHKIIDASDDVAIEARKKLDATRDMPGGASPAFSQPQERSVSEIAADIVNYQIGHNPDLQFRESETRGGPSTNLMHDLQETLHDVAYWDDASLQNPLAVAAKNIYDSMFSPNERDATFLKTPHELRPHIIDYIKNIHELVLQENGPRTVRPTNEIEARADANYQAAQDRAAFLHEQGYQPNPLHPSFRHNPPGTVPPVPRTLGTPQESPNVVRGNFDPTDPYGFHYSSEAQPEAIIPPGRKPKEPYPDPAAVERYIRTGIHDPNAEVSPAELAANVEKYKDNPRMLTQVLKVVDKRISDGEDAIDGLSLVQPTIGGEIITDTNFRDYHQEVIESGEINGVELTEAERTKALDSYNQYAKGVHDLTSELLSNADRILQFMNDDAALRKARNNIEFHLTTHEGKVLRPDSAGTVTRRKQLADQITMLKMGIEQNLFGVDDHPRAVTTLDRYQKELARLEEGVPFPQRNVTEEDLLRPDTKASIEAKIPWYENRIAQLQAELEHPNTRPGDKDSLRNQITYAQDAIDNYREALKTAPVTTQTDPVLALRERLAARREIPDAAAINAAERRLRASVTDETTTPPDATELPPESTTVDEPGTDLVKRPPSSPQGRKNVSGYQDPIFGGGGGNRGLPPSRGTSVAEYDPSGHSAATYQSHKLIVNRGRYSDNLIDRLFEWASDKMLSLDPEQRPFFGYTRGRQNRFLAREYGTSADRVRRAFYNKREELQQLVNDFADLTDTETTAIIQAHLQGVFPTHMKRVFQRLLKDESTKLSRDAIPQDIRNALVQRTVTQEQLRRLLKILQDTPGMEKHIPWFKEYMKKTKDQGFHDDQLLSDIFTDFWRPSHDLKQQVKLWTAIVDKVGDTVTPIMQKAIDEARVQSRRIDDLLESEGVLPKQVMENRRYQRQRVVSSILGEEIPINENAIYVPDRTIATTPNSFLMNRARSYDIKKEFGGRLAKNKGEALVSGRLNPSFDSYYTNLTSAISKTDAIRLQHEILAKYAHKVPQNQITYDGYRFVLFDARKGISLHDIETRPILQDLNESIDRGGISLSRLGNEQRVRGRNEQTYNKAFSTQDIAARDVGDLYLVPRPVYDAMVSRTAKAQFDSKFGRTQQRLVHTWRHIALALRPAYMVVNTAESGARTMVFGGVWSPFMWARIARIKSNSRFRNKAGEYFDDFGVLRGGGADKLTPPHIKRTSLSQNLMRRYHFGSQAYKAFGDERHMIREVYTRAKRSPYFGTPIEVAKFIAGGYGTKILSMTARGENYLREAMIISKELKAVRKDRYGVTDYRRYTKGIDTTMHQLMERMANGHNPFLQHEMDHVVKETARVLGDFSKADRPLLGVIAPFYRWMEFITKFVLWEAPAHYPGRTLLLSQLGNMGWDELSRMGLLPSNIQGSIPASGLSDRQPDPDQDKIDKIMTLMYTQAWNGPSTVANLFGVNAATGEIGASGLIKNLNPFYQSMIAGALRFDLANRRELRDANNQPFPGGLFPILQLTAANMARSFWPAVVGYDYSESADNSIPYLNEIYRQPSKNAQQQSSTAQQLIAAAVGTRFRPYDITTLQKTNMDDARASLKHTYNSLADARHPHQVSPAQQKFKDQLEAAYQEQLKTLHTWIDMYGPIPDSALFGGNP